jgi:hypothetical protein
MELCQMKNVEVCIREREYCPRTRIQHCCESTLMPNERSMHSSLVGLVQSIEAAHPLARK